MSQDHQDPVVKVGHPDFQKQLSEEDEKRIDEKGRPVVEGINWGRAQTGLYFTVFVTQGEPAIKADRKVMGQCLVLSPTLSLGLFSSRGKPKFAVAGWGASLELPSDLAQDGLKILYVTEWVINTVQEALEQAGGDPPLLSDKAVEMVIIVDAAIQGVGL